MTPHSVDAGRLPPPRPAVMAARPLLGGACGGRVSTGDLDRLSYARDMWPLAMMWIRQGRIPPPPDAVVWPGSEAEIAELTKIARAQKLALIPYGAGSGVCGGTWAHLGGVTVDVKRLGRIGEIDARHRQVEVGAGVMGETLERHLNARGWTLGHFPSSIYMSTVGGWLAARSAGQLSSRYGKIEDMTLSVRAVLGTGELVVTPQRPTSEPDLAALLIGSEGTLCTFTGATLRVFPAPAARVFHGFEFGSVEKGLEAIRLIFREGLTPAVVRLYDPFDTAFVGKGRPKGPKSTTAPSFRSPLERRVLPAALEALGRKALRRSRALNALQGLFKKSRLILMFEGDPRRAEAEDRAATDICRRLGADDLGEEPGRQWLHKRYDVSYRMSPVVEAGAFADTMEVSAPWDRVHEVYARVHQAASKHAFVLCHFSHAYVDGCSLYFSFVGSDANEAALEERYHQLWRSAISAALSAGANASHHHGVGLLKARALQESLGEGRHALQALKGLFDPDGIMNPGKLGL